MFQSLGPSYLTVLWEKEVWVGEIWKAWRVKWEWISKFQENILLIEYGELLQIWLKHEGPKLMKIDVF